MNAIPDFIEMMIAESADSIQANFALGQKYNSGVEAHFDSENHFARTSLDEIGTQRSQLGEYDRLAEKNSLPARKVTDEKGVASLQTDDPRPALRDKIKKMVAARNARMKEPKPGRIDFARWLKTQRGQVLMAAPAPKRLPEIANLFETFEQAQKATDAAKSAYLKTLTAKLPIEEAVANARAYVDALAAKGAPSVYDFFAAGNWDHRGKFAAKRGMSKAEFVTDQVGWNGNVAIEVVEADALFAFFARDLMFAGLEKLIREQGNDADAIPAEERQRRVSDAAGKVLSAMRHEAFVGLECVRRNVPVHLRRIIHPAVYLGVDVLAQTVLDWEP